MRDRDNRYLKKRGGRYSYHRRVPTQFQHLDERGTIVEALGTDSLSAARQIRDALEEADNAHWASLSSGNAGDGVSARYQAAKARAKSLGFSFRPLDQLVSDAPLKEIVGRVGALKGKKGVDLTKTADAVLGGAPEPNLPLSKALDEYFEVIAPEELSRKSPKQVESYKKVKRRAVTNFIALCGDKHLWDIDREDALKVYDWWQARITGASGKAPMSGNSGNRDIGNLRRIWRELANRNNRRDLHNPFDGLTFRDPKRLRKSPLPFPTEWIRDKLLRLEAYAITEDHPRKLNRDAAAVFLTVLETGCRPSEICNLQPDRIRLSGNIPHLMVDFDEQREIKTESSTRAIPLVGIAREVMRLYPDGFERYRDKETNFSNAMMKHLRRRGLLPTDRHVVYSARHAFEDRLKDAGVDAEMRRLLMGHSIDRPEYGSGGSLALRLKLLKPVALPYDDRLLEFLAP